MKRERIFGTNLFHMEQILTYEVVSILLKEEKHTRGIAEKLNINHMAIVRQMRELIKQNVVDFRKEGKNKVYFLKSSMEAKNYIFMSEYYKLNKTLKKYPELRSLIDSIQKNRTIKLAILFGSYAKGTATKNSDIDLFVETRNKKLKEKLELLNSRLRVQIGKYNRSNPVIREIERDHIIVKGVELFYEKTRFFD